MSVGIDPIPQDDPLIDATRHMGERWYRWLSTVVDALTAATARVAQTTTIPPAVHRPSGSAAILPITLLTPTTAGLYRVSWTVQVTAAATTSSAVTVTLAWTANSVAQTQAFPAITGNTTATHASGEILIYPTTGQPITIAAAYTSVGAAALAYTLDAVVGVSPVVTRRPATVADVEGIVALGQRFLAQSVYRGHLADNPAQVRALATRSITAPDGEVLVADAAGALVALLAIVAYAHHLSGERVAGELAFWVEPAYRGIGLRLLRDAERWARAQGAVRLELVAPTPDVETFYLRLGYAPLERSFWRELTAC